MPIIVQTINADGTVTNTYQPWTVEDVCELLATARESRRTSYISVGGITVATAEAKDALWTRFEKYIAEGYTEFNYTQPVTRIPVILPANAIMRISGVRDWYVDQCYKTEKVFWDAIHQPSANLQDLLAKIDNTQYWPASAFNWVATQADIDFETARQTLLAALGSN
jgi:hypothetical protein